MNEDYYPHLKFNAFMIFHQWDSLHVHHHLGPIFHGKKKKKLVEKMEVEKTAPSPNFGIWTVFSTRATPHHWWGPTFDHIKVIKFQNFGQNLKPRPSCHYSSVWMHRGGPHTCKAYYRHFPICKRSYHGRFFW